MIINPNFLAQLFYYFGNCKLVLEDGQLKRHLKILWLFEKKVKFLNASKIIVFDTEIGILGHKLTSGYKSGGADDNNLKVIGLSKKDIGDIKNYIISHNAQIQNVEGIILKSNFPLFTPTRWLSFREKIVINEKGIGHIRKGWFKTRQSFIPFESIKIYFYSGGLSKNIQLFGDTTIDLVENISNSCNDQIKNILLERGVTSAKGRKYFPALLSFKRGLSPDVLITTEKGILFKSNKLIGSKKNIYLGYEEINEFKKHGWYKLFAPVSIKGRRVDARKGEGGEVNIQIEGIAFYRWCTLLFFNGSLKATLMSNCR